MNIINYDKSKQNEIIDLLGDQDFKREIWSWQFLSNPLIEKFAPIVIAETKETESLEASKVIGFNGYMPVKVKLANSMINGIWSCDFVIHKDFRRKGLGKDIKIEQQARNQLVMAFGISDMASPLLKSMGWKSNEEVESYQRIKKIVSLKSVVIWGIQVINRLKYLVKSFNDPGLKARHLGQTDLLNGIDVLWDRVESGYEKTVVRDCHYIKWKYVDHPLCDYQFIGVYRRQTLQAIGVYRVTKSYAKLVDYIGPAYDEVLKFKILWFFTRYNRQHGTLSCVSSDQEFKKILQSLGYRRTRTKPRFYIWSANEEGKQIADNWFIMGGDSDADLLAAARDYYLEG